MSFFRAAKYCAPANEYTSLGKAWRSNDPKGHRFFIKYRPAIELKRVALARNVFGRPKYCRSRQLSARALAVFFDTGGRGLCLNWLIRIEPDCRSEERRV